MANSYIDLKDIGTTREVLLTGPPHGVRNLILIAAAVLAAVTVGLGFWPLQQTQTAAGLVVAADQPRTVVAGEAGTVGQVGAADGATVEAGQTILALDVSNAEEQLAVLTQQRDGNAADITAYQQLRRAALTQGNPFDPVTQASFHYTLEQYRQNLAQAGDTTRQASQTQSASRSQAQAALDANQTALDGIDGRITQLSALAASVRDGSTYASADDYTEALYRSWQAGRPDPTASRAATATGQSPEDYDAAFVAQVEGQVADLQAQRDSYSTQVAQLRSQLAQPVLDPSADPSAAVTAEFMLSASTAEQQLQTQQATLSLQVMNLRLQIDQAEIKAPVAGLLDAPAGWTVGDQVQAGQQVFRVVPPSGRLIEAIVPASAVAAVATGQSIPCAVPDDPAGRPADLVCRVDHVPANYDTGPDGQPYYAVRLSVDTRSDLAGYGANLPTGLPVSLTIPVRTSSALRWLAEKIGLVQTVGPTIHG